VERRNRGAAEPRRGRIEKRVWIKASAPVVYRALTDSKELGRWFCDRASCDPREGGELIACWNDGKSIRKGKALYKRVKEGAAVELEWVDEGDGAPAKASRHTLSFAIRSKSGMTELCMQDDDEADSDPESLEALDEGWNAVLLELKDFCEHRERSSRLRAHPRPQSGDQETP